MERLIKVGKGEGKMMKAIRGYSQNLRKRSHLIIVGIELRATDNEELTYYLSFSNKKRFHIVVSHIKTLSLQAKVTRV